MAKVERNAVRRRPSSKWRKSVGNIAGLFVLLLVFAAISTQREFPSEALAQQATHSDHERGQVHLDHAVGQTFEALIDGSMEPERVPDTVAIRALMQTLRVPSDPDATNLERLRAQVYRVNFSEADLEVLVHELGRLDTHAKDQQAIIEAVRPSSGEAEDAEIARYVEEQKKLGSIFVDHYQQILTSLSSAGAEKLQEHLIHIKSRIKIYPTPNMSSQVN